MDQNPPPPPIAIPDEILLEIFSKLSVKALLRFQCVSKSWNALISNDFRSPIKKLPPPMCGIYRSNIEQGLAFTNLASRTYIDTTSIDTNFTFSRPYFYRNPSIIDYCNGLFLILDDDYRFLHVCNPATRKWAQIPRQKEPSSKLVLSCDPYRSPHFKVTSFTMGKTNHLEVYSSVTREWKEITGVEVPNKLSTQHAYVQHSHVVISNEIFYVVLAHVDYECTYAIDVEKKTCRTIQVPEVGHKFWLHNRFLGVSGGCLHYAQIIDDELHVWVLEDSKSDKYVLKHRNTVRAIVNKLSGGGDLASCTHILTIHSDLDVLFLGLSAGPHIKLLAYHMISGNLEVICNVNKFGAKFWSKFWPYTPCYVEELDLSST